MYRAEESPGIERYLEPEYWGGQMIGEDRLLGLPNVEVESRAVPWVDGQELSMGSVIREAFCDSTERTARSILVDGEKFSPEAHPLGSLVLYRKEVLVKDPEKAERLKDHPESRPLPLGLTYSRAPILPGQEARQTRIVAPPFIYYSGERVGVIARVITPNEDDANKLVYISSNKHLSRNDRTKGTTLTRIEKAPFSVGRSRRYVSKKGIEAIMRVNALEVYKVSKSPKPKKRKQEKLEKRDPFPEFFMPNLPVAQF